jgi:hypothetical protein
MVRPNRPPWCATRFEQGEVGRFAEVLQIIHATGALEFTRRQALR